MKAYRQKDGSLLIPFRVDYEDGAIGEGRKLVYPGDPEFDAWLPYAVDAPSSTVRKALLPGLVPEMRTVREKGGGVHQQTFHIRPEFGKDPAKVNQPRPLPASSARGPSVMAPPSAMGPLFGSAPANPLAAAQGSLRLGAGAPSMPPAFDPVKWAGHTKAKDLRGRPLILAHHAGPVDRRSWTPALGAGAHIFTAEPAKRKAGHIAAYVRIENPAWITDVRNAAGKFGVEGGLKQMILDPRVAEELQRKGFDGAMWVDGDEPFYAVLSPASVKVTSDRMAKALTGGAFIRAAILKALVARHQRTNPKTGQKYWVDAYHDKRKPKIEEGLTTRQKRAVRLTHEELLARHKKAKEEYLALHAEEARLKERKGHARLGKDQTHDDALAGVSAQKRAKFREMTQHLRDIEELKRHGKVELTGLEKETAGKELAQRRKTRAQAAAENAKRKREEAESPEGRARTRAEIEEREAERKGRGGKSPVDALIEHLEKTDGLPPDSGIARKGFELAANEFGFSRNTIMVRKYDGTEFPPGTTWVSSRDPRSPVTEKSISKQIWQSVKSQRIQAAKHAAHEQQEAAIRKQSADAAAAKAAEKKRAEEELGRKKAEEIERFRKEAQAAAEADRKYRESPEYKEREAREIEARRRENEEIMRRAKETIETELREKAEALREELTAKQSRPTHILTLGLHAHLGSKPWVAEITGGAQRVGERDYDLTREFIDAEREFSKSGRTHDAMFDIRKSGLYQIGGTKHDNAFLLVFTGNNGKLKSSTIDEPLAREIARKIDKNELSPEADEGQDFDQARIEARVNSLPPTPDPPREGEQTLSVAGNTLVLRDGRWHRVEKPEPPREPEKKTVPNGEESFMSFVTKHSPSVRELSRSTIEDAMDDAESAGRKLEFLEWLSGHPDVNVFWKPYVKQLYNAELREEQKRNPPLSQALTPNQQKTARLVKIGGNVWQGDYGKRVYFNNLSELYGLQTRRYGTGNIASATLDGKEISNSRARQIESALGGKLWFDENSGQFKFKDLDEDDAAVIIQEINKRASASA